MGQTPRALPLFVCLLAAVQVGCGTLPVGSRAPRFATPADPGPPAAAAVAPALRVESGSESPPVPGIEGESQSTKGASQFIDGSSQFAEGASPGAAGVSPAPSVTPGALSPDDLLDHPGFSLQSLATEIAALRTESATESATEPAAEPAASYRPARSSEGNRFALHPDADGFAALRDLIRGASRSISIETFGFTSDPIAMGLAELLAQRRAEGLAVRVLVDGYKVKADAPVLKYLAERGVAVRRYNPKVVYKLGFNITHRKIYAADSIKAMTGGMNLGKRYECCVHDYLLSVEGQAARDLTAEFESDWNASGAAEQVLDPLTAFDPPSAPGAGKATVVVTSRREADRAQEIRRALSGLVGGAKQEVVFAYPYFSDDTFLRELKAAIKRGVRVRAILPAETDESVMRILNPLNANQLWKAGGEVRLFDSHFSHAKYLFVDGKKALMGSSNADAITFKFNQEASLLIEDEAFVAEARNRLAETDWAASRPPRYGDLHLPWYQAPKGALYELFDFVL